MKTRLYFTSPAWRATAILMVTVGLLATGCQPDELKAKRQELDKARQDLAAAKEKIARLEKEIDELDTTRVAETFVRVTPIALAEGPFAHYAEVRGAAQSRRNVVLSSPAGGEIAQVWVREGQRVAAGQTLITFNADIVRNSLSELKSSYELARVTFERQEKLWKQNIGTELQYLQAKNTMEGLAKRIAATQAQLDQLIVKAPFAGAIDRVDALVGQVAMPGAPLVRMVSSQDLYIQADVSEEFVGKVSMGDPVEVMIPSSNGTYKSTVAAVGQVINPENRTFSIEIRLPDGASVIPNQVAVVRFCDYKSAKAIAVPTKYIQRDREGSFVFIVHDAAGRSLARKVYVTPGVSYGGQTEIKAGLAAGQHVVGEGFREVADGAVISLVTARK